MKYKELQVSVQVDGRPLEEYASVLDESSNTMTCWVASEEGKEFIISRSNGSASQGMSFTTFVDGREMSFHSYIHPKTSRLAHGQRVSSDTVLPFKFARLQLTEDEESSPAQRRLDLDALGTIEVLILRATVLSRSSMSKLVKTAVGDIGPMHERSKKAGVHCIAFGVGKKIGENSSSVRCSYMDTKDKPYCKLRFRYRSRDILLAQGIIPSSINAPLPIPDTLSSRKRPAVSRLDSGGSARTSSKRPRREIDDVQAPVKADPGVLSSETLQAQLDAMATTMDSLKANMNAIRTKLSESQVVKREPSPIRMSSSGDVIDLTLD